MPAERRARRLLDGQERPYRVLTEDLARLVSVKGLSRRRRQEKLARKIGDVRQTAPERAFYAGSAP
jgi:hypothetical protein